MEEEKCIHATRKIDWEFVGGGSVKADPWSIGRSVCLNRGWRHVDSHTHSA